MGSATVEESCVQLTPPEGGTGACWMPAEIDVHAGFHWTGSISLGSNAAGGEGMVFALQSQGAEALGAAGSGLGYVGLEASLGLAFDTYGGSNDAMSLVSGGSLTPLSSTVSLGNIEDGALHTLGITWRLADSAFVVHWDGENVLEQFLSPDAFPEGDQIWWGWTASGTGAANAHTVCGGVFQTAPLSAPTATGLPCEGSPVTLTAAETGVTWEDGSTSDTLVVTGGGPYRYVWTDGTTGETLLSEPWDGFNPVASGTFTTSPEVEGLIAGGVSFVPDGSVGFTSLWSDGSTAQDRYGLAAGTYTLTTTTAAGCVWTDSAVVGYVPASTGLELEAFWDEDPGAGAGMALDWDSSTGAAIVDDSGLSPGVHRLGVRARDGLGRWGFAHWQLYYVLDTPPAQAGLARAEAFLDVDPGPGMGHDLGTLDSTWSSASWEWAVAEALEPGLHHLYVRVQDDRGFWSAAVRQPFQIIEPAIPAVPAFAPIAAAECFVGDVDPGPGNGHPLELLPGDSAQAFGGFPIGDLVPGTHRIMVRTADFLGRWSMAQPMEFTVEADSCTAPDPSFTWAAYGDQVTFTAAASDTLLHAWDLGSDGVVDTVGAVASWAVASEVPFLVAHTASVDDACAASDIAVVDFGTDVFAEATVVGNLWLCAGDTTFLEAPAGTGHVWNVGVEGAVLAVTQPGIYQCAFTNAAGQTAITSPLTLTTDAIDLPTAIAYASGGTNGSIELEFPPLANDVDIAWAHGPTAAVLTGLSAGTYTATLTSQFCSAELEVVVPVASEGTDGLTLEHFWDEDPGAGNGLPLDLAATDPVSGVVELDVSGLTPGIHRLGVRAHSAATGWSHAQFYAYHQPYPAPEQDVLELAEVFFDTDPGPGNGYTVPFDAGGFGDYEVPVGNLAPGMHHAYMRVRGTLGLWSAPERLAFVVVEPLLPEEPQLDAIVEAEYFIGADPGASQGTPLQLEPGVLAVAWKDVPVEGLPIGTHTVQLRSRGLSSGWSFTQSRTFEIFAPTCAMPEVDFITAVDGNEVQFASTSTNLLDSCTFAWDFNMDEVPDASAPDTIYTFANADQPVVVTLTVDNGGGCAASAQQVLFPTSSATELPLLVVGDLQLCGGDSVMLIAPAGGSNYVWNNGLVGDTLVAHEAGWFQCNFMDATGQIAFTQALSVALNPLPSFEVTTGDGTAQLIFPSTVNSAGLTYLWSDGSTTPFTSDLALGDHSVVVSNGACSASVDFSIEDLSAATFLALEYFLDEDPGTGYGTPWPSIPSSGGWTIGDLDLDSLSPGLHRLGVRSRTSDGLWGFAQFIPFFAPAPVEPTSGLVAAEYFYDADPGAGSGTPIPMTPGVQVAIEDLEIDGPTDVLGGTVLLSIRFQAANGKWGATETTELFVCDAPDAPVLAVDALTACSNATLVLGVPAVADVIHVWTRPNGTLFEGDSLFEAVPQAGTYAVQARSLSGCSSYPATVEVTLDDVPSFASGIAGNASICSELGGTPFTIAGDDDWTYAWASTFGTWEADGNSATLTVPADSTGALSIQVVASNACGSASSAVLVANVVCVEGCTDDTACNYDDAAVLDDGSCAFPPPGGDCSGCFADVDEDGVCDDVDPCVGAYSVCGVCNGPEVDTDGDGVPDCVEVPGCMDPTACNYDAEATDEDGSCCFGGCFTYQPLTTAYSSSVEVIDVNGDVVETLTGFGSLGSSTCIATSCQGVQLPNANAVGVAWTLLQGDSLYSGTLEASQIVALQWTEDCAGAPGDAEVTDVQGDADSYLPGAAATVMYQVGNVGFSALAAGWTERLFVTNESETIEFELGTWTGTEVAAGDAESRSRQVTLPDPLGVGGFGRFGVELIAPAGAVEYLANATNNRAVEAEAWTVGGALTWSVATQTVNEGASKTVQLHRSGSVSTPLTVALSAAPAGELNHPATVYFPVNSSTRSVTFTAIDDALLVGNATAVATASAAGYGSDDLTWTIVEDETPQLSVALAAAEITEGDTLGFTVSTNLVPEADLTVYLNYANPQQLSGPSSLVIPAGALSVDAELVAVNNNLPESTMTLTVLAGAANHDGGTAALTIVDEDIPDLVLELTADTVSEGVGAFAVEATLSRSAEFAGLAVNATLTASIAGQIFHPTAIQLNPGDISSTFNVGVIDNALDDGTRSVVLEASVVFSNCGCAAEPGSFGYAADTLVILDNDGMALTVSISPSVMPEGASGGTLLLSHNSDLPAPVSVALSANPLGELELPASVQLPAGTGSVSVPFGTLNDGIEDGTQQVFVTATAPGFNAGQSTVFVTDQNKPNLEVASASLSADTVTPGNLVILTAEVENTGFVTMPSGWSWTLESDEETWYTGTFTFPLPVGSTAELVASVTVPESPGTVVLELVVNGAASPTEINYTTNTFALGEVEVESPYLPVISVAADYLPGGSPVPFTGTLTGANGTALASTPVEVYVLNGPYRREIDVTTNSLGQFSGTFTPYSTEQGTYTIGAGYPGLMETAVQDTFDLLGLKLEAPNSIVWNGITGESIVDSIQVHNPTSVDLTGLVVTAPNAWSGAQPTFTAPTEIPAGATLWIPYAVDLTAATPNNAYHQFNFSFTADQGTIETWPAYVFIQDPYAVLETDPNSLVVSVSDQIGTKVVEFDVTNVGGGNSGPIGLSLPQGDWIGSLVGGTLPDLAPGETTTVTLLFTATNSVPLQYTVNGNLGLNPDNGISLSLPFQFTRVSDANASLSVLATNQFTYFAEDEPPVVGADVRVETYYGSNLLAEGVTDSTGWFHVDSIPEGPVRIIVEKPQHADAVLEVNLNAGLANIYTAFLDFQPVTYWWEVEEVEIEDSYTITLNSTFVTHVPMPVLRLEIPDSLPALQGDELFVFNAVLINDGLIAFDEVEMVLPEDPEYEFLSDYLPSSLPALTAVEVPVIMRRIDAWSTQNMEMGDNEGIEGAMMAYSLNTAPVAAQMNQGAACRLFFAALGAYECGFGQTMLGQALAAAGISERSCGESGSGSGESNPTFYDGEGNCDQCSGSGPDAVLVSGGGGTIGDFDSGIELCDDCFQSLVSTALNCAAASAVPSKTKDCVDAGIGSLMECLVKPQLNEMLGASLPPNAPNALSMLPDLAYPGTHYAHLVQQLAEYYGTDIASAMANTLVTSGLADTSTVESDILQAFIAANASELGDLMVAASPNFGANAVEDEEAELGIYAPYHAMFVDYSVKIYGLAAETVYLDLVYGDLFDYEAFEEFYLAVNDRVLAIEPFSTTESDSLIATFGGYEWGTPAIQGWFTDWNAHVAEYGSENPDFDWDLFDRQLTLLAAADYFAIVRGMSGFEDFFFTSEEAIAELIETGDSGGNESGVCAAVQMQIEQELTMTREAFEGTFGISNGHPSGAVQFLDVNVQVFDPDGIPRNDLFQIELIETSITGSVDGNGVVPSGEQGTAVFLFIPEQGAAPTEPIEYGFGGTVSYYDPSIQGMVTQALDPVYLTVEPSPDLQLDYYLDRTVYGDDPLTEPIEPILPAELSLMIHNAGYGDATNVLLASSQPTIVGNDMGLAVAFEIIGSQFEGEDANLGVLDVEFGDIPPFESRIGSWFLTSNLLGYFTNLSADVVHNNSYGNPELSLIESVEFHELIHRVRNPMPGDDGRDEFLVNSFSDPFAMPDEVHFSDGDSIAEVLVPADLNASDIAPATATSTVEVTPSDSGWTYFRIPSPGGEFYELVEVQRADGSVLPAQNAWVTKITVPMTGDPIHEPVFHLFDWTPTDETYTLVWEVDFDTPLEITSIEGVANGEDPEILFEQLDSLVVQFDRPIVTSTFTADDIQLWNQGAVAATDGIVIVPLDADSTRFALDLTDVTGGDGLYQITIGTIGITDFTGAPGENGQQRTWVQWVGRPYVMSAIDAFDVFRDVDEPIYIGEVMPHLDLIFNTAMVDSTVGPDHFTLMRGDTLVHEFDPYAMDLDARLQRLDSLDTRLAVDGEYTLEVDLTSLLAESGLYGLAPQSIELVRDRIAPELVAIELVTTGGLDAQHVTALDLVFSEAVVGLDTANVVLTRDANEELNWDLASLGDGQTWRLNNFNLATYPEGQYALTIEQPDGIQDLTGLPLALDTLFEWSVIRTDSLEVVANGISPDWGISSTDAISFGANFNLLFSVSEYAPSVVIEQQVGNNWLELATLEDVAAGDVSVPVVSEVEGGSVLRIRATSLGGFEHVATQNIFLDPINLNGAWEVLSATSEGVVDGVEMTFTAPVLDGVNFQNKLSLTRNGFPVPLGDVSIDAPDSLHVQVTGLATALTDPGEYTLSMTMIGIPKRVTGRMGTATPSISWVVDSPNTAPVANAGPDAVLDSLGLALLNGSNSFDADGDMLSYTWHSTHFTFPQGTAGDTVVVAPVSGLQPGVYSVVLMVSDGVASDVDVVAVTVPSECSTDSDGDGVCDEDEVFGCTDNTASNYLASATEEDGSCIWATPCTADIDNNGIVNMSDVLIMLGEYSSMCPEPGDCLSDIDGSGYVSMSDLLVVLSEYGLNCN